MPHYTWTKCADVRPNELSEDEELLINCTKKDGNFFDAGCSFSENDIGRLRAYQSLYPTASKKLYEVEEGQQDAPIYSMIIQNEDWRQNAYPSDPDVIDKYPTVSPVGKYTELDMLFATREQRIREAVVNAPEELKNYVLGLLNDAEKTTDYVPLQTLHQTHCTQLSMGLRERVMNSNHRRRLAELKEKEDVVELNKAEKKELSKLEENSELITGLKMSETGSLMTFLKENVRATSYRNRIDERAVLLAPSMASSELLRVGRPYDELVARMIDNGSNIIERYY